MKELSRRKFLTMTGLGLSAAVLEACGPGSQSTPTPFNSENNQAQATASAVATRETRVPGTSTATATSAPQVELNPTQEARIVNLAAKAAVEAVRAVQTPGATPTRVDASPTAAATATRVEATQVPGNARLEAPRFVEDISHGKWTIKGTDRLKDNPIVANWLRALKDPEPQKGRNYPNIQGNYPLSEFDVKAGMEYGVANVPFSEHPKGADFIVPAWHYRLFTGPYKFMGEDHTNGDKANGQALIVINVMKESVTFSDPNQEFRNGFTVAGRFWDGNKLDQGTWALVNHVTANMLNFPTESRMGETLNAGTPGNAGANCGIPEGCRGVDVNIIVVAGDAVIAQAKAVVTR